MDTDFLKIEITDAQGTKTFDPNSLVRDVFGKGLIRELVPSEQYPSISSGAPGVAYKTHAADLYLTSDELHRMVARALTPKEFFAIRRAAGNIFEIHNDFYDPETGEAFQPAIPIQQTNFADTNDAFFIQLSLDNEFYSLERCLLYAFQVSIPHVDYNFISLTFGDPDFQRDVDYNPHIKRAVIVFTQGYFGKPWTDAVFREVKELIGRGIDIVPVWWGVTPDEIAEYLPPLRHIQGLAAPDIDFQVVPEFFRFADTIATTLSDEED